MTSLTSCIVMTPPRVKFMFSALLITGSSSNMAIIEQEAAKSSHTHLVMVILVVCFALCVSLLFVALRFWCPCIIGFSYWDDAAAVMALVGWRTR